VGVGWKQNRFGRNAQNVSIHSLIHSPIHHHHFFPMPGLVALMLMYQNSLFSGSQFTCFIEASELRVFSSLNEAIINASDYNLLDVHLVFTVRQF
jgi:hypothetical protein